MIRATRKGRAKPPAETGPLGPEGAWQRVHELFTQRGWQPFDFQQQAWRSYLAGESGLIHAGTGMGKTWGGVVGARAGSFGRASAGTRRGGGRRAGSAAKSHGGPRVAGAVDHPIAGSGG